MPEPVSAAVSRGINAERRRVQRGFESRVSRSSTETGAPPALTSVPTVTQNASAGNFAPTSAISNSVLIGKNDTRFRIFGGEVAALDSFFNYANGAASYISPNPGGASGLPFCLDFETDAPKFEIYCKNTTGKWRLWVDGQMDATIRTMTPQDNTHNLVLVDFGSSAVRRVMIETELNYCFGGVRIDKTYGLWRSQFPLGPKVYVLGDSFTAGAGATWGHNGYARRLAYLMGWWNLYQGGYQGTGYLGLGSGGKKYVDRVPLDIVPRGFDVVLVQGSTNDNSFTPSNIAAQAAAVYSAIRAGLPRATLIVSLPVAMTSSNIAALVANRDAMLPIAQQYAHLVIDGQAEPWVTGDGKITATNGHGNADRYTFSDGIHPSDDGHVYLARRTSAAIAAALPL